jgi:hypothetical protein
MDFGEFTLVLEDEGVRREVLMNATLRAPIAGEWVDVDGQWYQVRLVTHAPVDTNTLRRQLEMTIYAIPIETGGEGTPGPDSSEDDSEVSEPSPSKAGQEVKPNLFVVEFTPPGTSACEYLPAPLVLTLVACAYSEQNVLFEAGKFESWRLVHDGSRLFLERRLGDADECRRLSREALYQFRQAEDYILKHWPLVATASDPSNVFDLAVYRRIKKESAHGGRL